MNKKIYENQTVKEITPDEIRTKLIEEFKKDCPKGILEAFKNDNEIWEYIVENSQITVKFEDEENENEDK